MKPDVERGGVTIPCLGHIEQQLFVDDPVRAVERVALSLAGVRLLSQYLIGERVIEEQLGGKDSALV